MGSVRKVLTVVLSFLLFPKALTWKSQMLLRSGVIRRESARAISRTIKCHIDRMLVA